MYTLQEPQNTYYPHLYIIKYVLVHVSNKLFRKWIYIHKPQCHIAPESSQSDSCLILNNNNNSSNNDWICRWLKVFFLVGVRRQTYVCMEACRVIMRILEWRLNDCNVHICDFHGIFEWSQTRKKVYSFSPSVTLFFYPIFPMKSLSEKKNCCRWNLYISMYLTYFNKHSNNNFPSQS